MRYPFLPGDIFLLYGGDSPFDRLEKWALGSPFVHCFIRGTYGSYIIESIGKGVAIMPLHNYTGRRVRVMRYLRAPNVGEFMGPGLAAAAQAEAVASNPGSYYDYLALTKWVLPRLICQKLGLPVPLSWHRNRYFLCSELVAEAYLTAGYPIVPDDIVPLPGDFAESPKLESLGDITL